LEKSKFFPALFIISGVGLKFRSVYLETQANKAYDNYLHTALQADMEKYTDEYNNKYTQSIIASRVGDVFWGLAVFISIYRQLQSISVEKGGGNTELRMQGSVEHKLGLLSSPTDTQTNTSIRQFLNVPEVHGRNGDALFVISLRF
jgi:hypothetical protein